ncbi:MAG: SDR family NAD(P)-dependent oxidoreductase [Lachnospiraceae bacterium]|nr:SDR family NAD(P)-dependent oxidoreductase [Lachnospiraceae bacterium]
MVAIVTGSSSGIGFEVCKQLCERGYTVYGISRRGLAPEGVTAMSADVSNSDALRAVIDEIARREGRIDLLVANAGMGISGPVELSGNRDMQQIMNVNFFGQVYAAQAVLPYMRAQKGGSIVFVSSVAAPIAIPYQAFYSASKSAINSVALALRNEVRGYNIRISVVMPGDASTGFTDARVKNHPDRGAVSTAQSAETQAPSGFAAQGIETQAPSGIAAQSIDSSSAPAEPLYPRCDAAVASMERDERTGMPASKVAGVIVRAGTKKNPAPLYVAGFKYRLLLALYNILPARAAVWLVGKFY